LKNYCVKLTTKLFLVICGLILLTSCENEPISLNPEGGNTFSFKTFTIGEENSSFSYQHTSFTAVESNRLYVGKIDPNKISHALIIINPDSLLNNDMCSDTNIVEFTSVSFEMIAKNNIPNSHFTEIDSLNDFDRNGSESTFINSRWVVLDDSWLTPDVKMHSLSDSDFDSLLGETQIDATIDGKTMHIPIQIQDVNNNWCTGSTDKVYGVLLSPNEDFDYLVEFYSSEYYSTPHFEFTYDKKSTEVINENIYEIIEVSSDALDVLEFDSNFSDTLDAWGTILSYDVNDGIIINSSSTPQELFSITITPNESLLDSISEIQLYINPLNTIFSYDDNDPTGDNEFCETDSLGVETCVGTEGNGTFDEGEYFYDVGIDNLSSEEENGYDNADPNEANGILDDSELESWFDLGNDNAPDSLENGCGGKLEITYSSIIETLELDSVNFNIEEYIVGDDTTTICGQLYWGDEGCNNCSFSDPNGDDYNIDPNGDDYDEETETGFEGNGVWDFLDCGIDSNNEEICADEDAWVDTFGNGVWDVGELFEPFLDYGIDQLAGYFDADSSEGNGKYDEGEYYYDTGIDGLYNSNEIDYNPTGTENNDELDSAEDFNDCGVDSCTNDIDPTGDDYSPINLEGFEGNGEWDFLDCGIDSNNEEICANEEAWADNLGNGVWDVGEPHEKWDDYGTDQTENSEETNFGNNSLDYTLGSNLYSLDLDNPDSITYSLPDISENDMTLGITQINYNENESTHELVFSIQSNENITGMQFQLSHIQYSYTIGDTIEITQSVTDGVVEDVSLYTLDDFTEDDTLRIQYGHGIETHLTFDSLAQFIDEHKHSIISDDFTKLILYIDSTSVISEESTLLYINRETEDDEGYLLNYPYFKTVSSTTDSIIIDFGEAIQRYITGEYDYEGFTLKSDGQTFNFSQVKLDPSKKPKLEIFYSE